LDISLLLSRLDFVNVPDFGVQLLGERFHVLESETKIEEVVLGQGWTGVRFQNLKRHRP
jgi:hypothetical protein